MTRAAYSHREIPLRAASKATPSFMPSVTRTVIVLRRASPASKRMAYLLGFLATPCKSAISGPPCCEKMVTLILRQATWPHSSGQLSDSRHQVQLGLGAMCHFELLPSNGNWPTTRTSRPNDRAQRVLDESEDDPPQTVPGSPCTK